MTMRKHLVLFCLCFTTIGGQAQINAVGSVDGGLRVVRSLPSAGVKLYRETANTLDLYNLDLSSYMTITFPPLPSGSSYFSVLYITENTFDTDPQSIELMTTTTDENFMSGIRIFRDDGTILLDSAGTTFGGSGGFDDLTERPPLFMGDDGTVYMALSDLPAAPNAKTTLYQLPGVLPCLDCSGMMVGGLSEDQHLVQEEPLAIYPNPATDAVTIVAGLPEGQTGGRILVRDAAGRLVRNVAFTSRGPVHLSMAGHAAGRYSCSVVVNGQVMRTGTFLLAGGR